MKSTNTKIKGDELIRRRMDEAHTYIVSHHKDVITRQERGDYSSEIKDICEPLIEYMGEADKFGNFHFFIVANKEDFNRDDIEFYISMTLSYFGSFFNVNIHIEEDDTVYCIHVALMLYYQVPETRIIPFETGYIITMQNYSWPLDLYFIPGIDSFTFLVFHNENGSSFDDRLNCIKFHQGLSQSKPESILQGGKSQ